MNYRGNIRDAWHELDADGSGKAGMIWKLQNLELLGEEGLVRVDSVF